MLEIGLIFTFAVIVGIIAVAKSIKRADEQNKKSGKVVKSTLPEAVFEEDMKITNKPKTVKNNKPKISVNTKVTADLLEYNCAADFIEDEHYIKKLERKSASKITNLMYKATNKLYKKENSDVLGYGLKFYGQKYNEMKKLGYSKDNIKEDISFNFKANVEIKSTELSIKSIKEKAKDE